MYAGMWTFRRKPWRFDDGGKNTGVYKTTDGGTSWKKIMKGRIFKRKEKLFFKQKVNLNLRTWIEVLIIFLIVLIIFLYLKK